MGLSELLDTLSDAECRKANALIDIGNVNDQLQAYISIAECQTLLRNRGESKTTVQAAEGFIRNRAPQIREECNEMAEGPGRFSCGIAFYYDAYAGMGDG